MANTSNNEWHFNIPCSSANVGPGFDVLGMALDLYMRVTVRKSTSSDDTLTFKGRGSDVIPSNKTNLIYQAFMHVINELKVERKFFIDIEINNDIPVGKGLGSSGVAVAAGVMIANSCYDLKLDTQQILQQCLKIEKHPDNFTPTIVGGFTACMTSEHDDKIVYNKILVNSKIKAVIVVPSFELPTSQARQVLPQQYSRADLVFNLQRAVTLISALQGDITLESVQFAIREAMKDRVHQPYRSKLVPGLSECIQLTMPGLLGVCLSGAGPSICALAIDNFDEIGNKIKSILKGQQVDAEHFVLNIVKTE